MEKLLGRLGRGNVAVATWWSELACVLLTGVYSMLAVSDVMSGHARWTSPSWFEEGFCVWRSSANIDSHVLCFVFDLVIGVALAVQNWKMYKIHRKEALLIAAVISVFNVAHGFGHLVVHLFAQMLTPVVQDLSLLGFLVKFIASFMFLAIGPFLGSGFGVRIVPCVLIHIVSTLAFVNVPLQFAFGAVQLVINFWYCIPRLLLIGCREPMDIKARVDDGLPANSFGITLVMFVVFSETLGCDAFFQSISGHFLYDLSILTLTAVFSVLVWQQCPKKQISDTHSPTVCVPMKHS